MDDLVMGCFGLVLIMLIAFIFIYYWYFAVPILLALVGLTIWVIKRRKAKQKEILEEFSYNSSTHVDRNVEQHPSKEVLNDEISKLEKQVKELKNEQQELIKTNKGAINIIVNKEIKRIDKFNGREFEKYCGRMLEKMGFQDVLVTVSSGDQGIDVTAQMGKTSYGFQCKHYSSPVGNKALQEVISGKEFYNVDKAVVITNNYFTPSAISLAKEAGIDTWNRDTLIDYVHDQVAPEVTNKSQHSDKVPESSNDSKNSFSESAKKIS